jgi:hypothetical protein
VCVCVCVCVFLCACMVRTWSDNLTCRGESFPTSAPLTHHRSRGLARTDQVHLQSIEMQSLAARYVVCGRKRKGESSRGAAAHGQLNCACSPSSKDDSRRAGQPHLTPHCNLVITQLPHWSAVSDPPLPRPPDPNSHNRAPRATSLHLQHSFVPSCPHQLQQALFPEN